MFEQTCLGFVVCLPLCFDKSGWSAQRGGIHCCVAHPPHRTHGKERDLNLCSSKSSNHRLTEYWLSSPIPRWPWLCNKQWGAVRPRLSRWQRTFGLATELGDESILFTVSYLLSWMALRNWLSIASWDFWSPMLWDLVLGIVWRREGACGDIIGLCQTSASQRGDCKQKMEGVRVRRTRGKWCDTMKNVDFDVFSSTEFLKVLCHRHKTIYFS